MTAAKSYNKVHTRAKGIIFTIIICLLFVDNAYANILAATVWYWGINPTAYMLEHICNLRHRHNKI